VVTAKNQDTQDVCVLRCLSPTSVNILVKQIIECSVTYMFQFYARSISLCSQKQLLLASIYHKICSSEFVDTTKHISNYLKSLRRIYVKIWSKFFSCNNTTIGCYVLPDLYIRGVKWIRGNKQVKMLQSLKKVKSLAF